MICIIALFVFAFLSIFSAKYRPLAKEAFDCALRRITLRPCVSGLDERIRVRVVAKVFKRSPSLAGFLNKNFELLSTIFFFAFLGSGLYLAYGAYSFITLGTCDPILGYCAFDDPKVPIVPKCNITSDFIFFYGDGCPHCADMKPILEQVEEETGVYFLWLEIWKNETNKQEFFSHASDIEEDCGFLGVPTFFSTKTNRAICGEVSKERLKRFIMENG